MTDSTAQRDRGGAVADLVRATEIARVLAAHGFDVVLDRAQLPRDPSVQVAAAEGVASGEATKPLAERIRDVLEALGPTFVKLGQVLSTRADIVPDDVALALRALQDRAQPLPLEQIKQVIEEDLGRPVAELFVRFDEAPLATASIAQVHRAVLRHEGRDVEVVVKVQRPGIRAIMRSDLSLLYWLGRALERTIEEVSAYSPTAIVEQFEKAVDEELDFVHERENLERAGRCFAARPDLLVVPQAFAHVSSSRVLVMGFLDGVKITDTKDDPRYDKAALRDRLVETAFKQVFEDGFFHGDPHPGNVLVLPDGRLGMIDFGLWGTLTSEQQDIILHWLTAIALKSPSTLVRLTLKVGQVAPGFDRQGYERDVRALMDKYVGIELDKLESASIIADSVEVIRRHRIKLPPDFAVLARGTATLEGIVRHLYPDLDVQALILPYVQKLIVRRFDPTRAGPEAMSLFLGLQDFLNEVPSQINQLLSDLSAGRFRVGLQGEALDDLTMVGRVHGTRLVLAMLGAACIVGAAVVASRLDNQVVLAAAAAVLSLAALGALLGITVTFVFPNGLRKIRLSSFLFWRRKP